MQELIGKKIESILIDKDEQHLLIFDTDAGRFVYVAGGDCCSESWFYHVLGVGALLNHTVLKCEEIGSIDIDDGLTRQEYDKLYGINLQTTGGHADIEFRNSSNGYYGGWLERQDTVPEEVNLIAITDDYTAQQAKT